MQKTEMEIQAGGTVTALPGMMESESYILQVARAKQLFFACASGAAF